VIWSATYRENHGPGNNSTSATHKLRIANSDKCARRRVNRFAIDDELGVSSNHEVQLLVSVGLAIDPLVVLLDHESTGLGWPKQSDTEGP